MARSRVKGRTHSHSSKLSSKDFVEILMTSSAAWASHVEATGQKEAARDLKERVSYARARERMLLLLGAMGDPSLKPRAIIEACESRRKAGGPEVPRRAYRVLAEELQRQRRAVETSVEPEVLQAAAAHCHHREVVRAAAGGCWALQTISRHQACIRPALILYTLYFIFYTLYLYFILYRPCWRLRYRWRTAPPLARATCSCPTWRC